MSDRSDGREQALKWLEDNLEAKVMDDPDWRYSLMRSFDVNMDINHPSWTMPTTRVEIPAKKIVLHPAQFERLLSVLSYVVIQERRESLGYRTAQESAAHEILTERIREERLRKSHPTVEAAWEQYQTALKLCS